MKAKSKSVRIRLHLIQGLRAIFPWYEGDDRELLEMTVEMFTAHANKMEIKPMTLVSPAYTVADESELEEEFYDSPPADDSELD